MKSYILRNTWQVKPTEYHACIVIYLLKKLLCRAGDFETYFCLDRGLMGQLCLAFMFSMLSTALLWWWDWPPPAPLEELATETPSI